MLNMLDGPPLCGPLVDIGAGNGYIARNRIWPEKWKHGPIPANESLSCPTQSERHFVDGWVYLSQ